MTQRARHAAVVALGIVALLALVAVASRGPTPGGRGGAQQPAEWALDIVASLVLVTLVPGSLLLIFIILLRPESLFHAPARRERKRGRLPSIVSLGIGVALIVLAVRRLASGDTTRGEASPGPLDGEGGNVPQRDAYEPSFALVPVLVMLVVLTVGASAATVAFRSRKGEVEPEVEGLAVAFGDVLDEALDDLRAEVDARRAVIAAYARLERVLAAFGLPRRASEAPEEYLLRALAMLELSGPAVARLTALFETAKFSQHDVKATMKEEAIRALEAVRDELRLAGAREREARETALALAREQAAG